LEKNAEKQFHEALNGFLRSRVLVAGHKLGLFKALAAESLTRDQVLEKLDLPKRSGTILINASLALGFLEEASGTLTCPPAMARLLVRESEDAFHFQTYMIEYYDALSKDLDNIEEIIRTNGRASRFKLRDYFKEDVSTVDPKHAADYSAYMDATMQKIVKVATEMYDFGQHKYLLDACGGPGTFCRALLARYPDLHAGLLEIPPVAEIAKKKLEGSGFEERMDVIGGDAFTAELPDKVDCITMCRSAHDWDDDKLEPLFKRFYEALPSGGRLLIIERMIPDEFDERAEPLYIRAVYFLAKSESALYRTPAHYKELLGGVGFSSVKTLDPPRDPYEFFQGLRIVVAEKS
jgi:demethylspheroidene O-methyltransferase